MLLLRLNESLEAWKVNFPIEEIKSIEDITTKRRKLSMTEEEKMEHLIQANVQE